MRQAFKYDNDGYFLEPVILQDNEELPENSTTRAPEQGVYRPRFVTGEWVEDMPAAEIDAIRNTPQPKTEVDILKEENAALKTQLETVKEESDLAIIEIWETILAP